MKIDKIDQKILTIMQAEGRITNSSLAKRVGISPPAMLERVKRLESARAIKKFVALVDPDQVGVGVIAFVRVTLAVHQMPEMQSFKDLIADMDEVLECYLLSGTDDYLLKVALESVSSYSEFTLKKLAAIPGVQSIKSSFVLGTIKYQTTLPVRISD